MNDRNIEFERIRNCRDLGGIRTASGMTIKKGILLRSSKLSGASPADLIKLSRELRLKKIVDLRTSMEITEKPDKTVPGAKYVHIPIFDEVMGGISHEEVTEKIESMFMSGMAELYSFLVSETPCRKNFARAVKTILAHEPSSGSILWHCTEGKDRCGLVTMLMLSILGVDRDVIMEDYLLTNEFNIKRAEQYYEMALQGGYDKETAYALKQSFLAKEEYLAAAFVAIDSKFEGTENYLEKGLGIEAEEMDLFRKNMLE